MHNCINVKWFTHNVILVEFLLKTSMFRVRLAVHLVEIIFMCSFLVLLETQDNTKNYYQSKMNMVHVYYIFISLHVCLMHSSLYMTYSKYKKCFPVLFQWLGSVWYGLYIFLVPISVLSITLQTLTELGKVETISLTFWKYFP